MAWKSYKELIVWQKSIVLVKEIYSLLRCLPQEERYVISDQMRRAAISIPSNIAEGHGRESEKDFKRFLSMAKGSVSELETQLTICQELGYLTEDQEQQAFSLCSEIRRMLAKLIMELKFD